MSETTVGLGYKLNRKLKVAVGTAKTSNRGSEGTSTRKNSRFKTENGVPDHVPSGGKRNSRFNSKDKRLPLGTQRYGEEMIDRKRGFGSETSDMKRKRVYTNRRDVDEEGKSDNVRVPNRKSFFKKGGGDTDDSLKWKRSAKGNSLHDSKVKRLPFGTQGYAEQIDRKRGFRSETSDMKRKRVYGNGRDVDEEGNSDNARVPYRKSLYRKGGSDTYDSLKWKRSAKGKSRDVEPSNIEKFSSTRGRNSQKDGFTEERSNLKEDGHLRGYRGKLDSAIDVKHSSRRAGNREIGEEVSVGKFKSKTKIMDRRVSTKLDGSEDGLLKKYPGNKSDSTKRLDQTHSNRYQVGSLGNSAKQKLRNKKGLEDDSDVKAGPPKKKKRVIRIDPFDISNKRIDDGISIDGKTVVKEVDLEKNVEVSKNAEFRAIQPSPSILSFVEDNLLGRRRLIELRRAGYNTDLSIPLDNIAFSTSSERERIEEAVFRNKLTFFAAAKVSSSFPPVDLPEVAFAGRSNVGKSSLLNGLTRQWGVVRTSDKPGLTQTINFFQLGSKLCLVDLPGYGFAYAKEEVKDAWEELVKEYVSTRVGLKRVCLLIDTKWGMKPRDYELINLMERSQTKYQIVLTKTDTVFPMDVARRAMQIEESLKSNKSIVQPLMMVSSKSGAGIRSLRTVLAKITRFAKL